MRINRGLLKWGLFFIVLGAVPLAVRQGLVDEDTVARAWTLWPLLLVLAGIALLLRRTPVETAADLAVSVLFGLIAGGLLASGTVPVAGCGDDQAGQPFQARSGDLADRADVELELSCGELTVQVAEGTRWTVEGADEDGDGPRLDASSGSLEVRSDRDTGFLDARDRWTVTLPAASEIALDARVNAGAGRLDLANARLRALHVGVNAGEATIDLGEVAALGELDIELNAVGNPRIVLPNLSFSGRIEANAAGGVRICAPVGAGLRFTVNDSFAASHNFAARGLTQDGNVWSTPGFDQAATRIDLRTQVNAGNFELEPEGACDA
jgi:hypothetical protein